MNQFTLIYTVLLTNLLVKAHGGGTYEAKFCDTDSDCKKHLDSCTCYFEGLINRKICNDHVLVAKGVTNCPLCASNADCAVVLSDYCIDDPFNGGARCSQCMIRVHEVVTNICATGSAPDSGSATPAQNAHHNSNQGSGFTGAAQGQSKSSSNQSVSQRTTGMCVSTEWLERNQLMHAATTHYGEMSVLCIPKPMNLPCGTPSHLLRVCHAKDSCKLVSYQELCSTRFDCLKASMRVSSLRHSFDWSSIRTPKAMDGTWIEVTSVSANEHAKRWSISRFVAVIANTMNRNGLGIACDLIQSLSTQHQRIAIFTHPKS